MVRYCLPLHSGIIFKTGEIMRIISLYVCVCKGCLREVMKSGWCGRHLQSLRHPTPNRPRRGRHQWSQTLHNQEPVERWLKVWSPCWGELTHCKERQAGRISVRFYSNRKELGVFTVLLVFSGRCCVISFLLLFGFQRTMWTAWRLRSWWLFLWWDRL